MREAVGTICLPAESWFTAAKYSGEFWFPWFPAAFCSGEIDSPLQKAVANFWKLSLTWFPTVYKYNGKIWPPFYIHRGIFLNRQYLRENEKQKAKNLVANQGPGRNLLTKESEAEKSATVHVKS